MDKRQLKAFKESGDSGLNSTMDIQSLTNCGNGPCTCTPETCTCSKEKKKKKKEQKNKGFY